MFSACFYSYMTNTKLTIKCLCISKGMSIFHTPCFWLIESFPSKRFSMSSLIHVAGYPLQTTEEETDWGHTGLRCPSYNRPRWRAG